MDRRKRAYNPKELERQVADAVRDLGLFRGALEEHLGNCSTQLGELQADEAELLQLMRSTARSSGLDPDDEHDEDDIQIEGMGYLGVDLEGQHAGPPSVAPISATAGDAVALIDEAAALPSQDEGLPETGLPQQSADSEDEEQTDLELEAAVAEASMPSEDIGASPRSRRGGAGGGG